MNSEDSTQQWGSLLPAHSVISQMSHGKKNFFHPLEEKDAMLWVGSTQAAGKWWIPLSTRPVSFYPRLRQVS